MTTQVRKAVILVDWLDQTREPRAIPVQYNPTEYTLDKQVTLGEVTLPGLDAPLQQYVRGNAEKMTLDLFFDTTENGMGPGASSVTRETDKIYQLIKIEPKQHAPPILTFVWNDEFPGSSVGAASVKGVAAPTNTITSAVSGVLSAARDAALSATGSLSAAAVALSGPLLGNQPRNGFRCILESIKQKFTLFSPDGVPLRATLTVTLREYRTLDDQLKQLDLESTDRTHAHVFAQADSLASVAHRYYDRPDDWRAIADHNSIADPRRLSAGRLLEIPPLR